MDGAPGRAGLVGCCGADYGRRLLLVRGEAVQAYERSRLPEVVTAEEQAKRDAAERRVQEAQNEMRLARRIERRTC